MADTRTRAIGYISTLGTMDSHSKNNQDQQIRQYCLTNNLLLVDMFADTDANENIAAREGLQAALSTLRAGEADRLIVTSTSRLSRSIATLAALVDEQFADGSRALVSIDEHMDTRTDQGQFMLRALCLIARWGRR